MILPEVIPVFPLDGALLLPGGILPLRIFEPRYLNMVDDAMAGERLIGMVQTEDGMTGPKPRLARVGCVGRITSYAETGEGDYLIALTGVCRFEALEEVPQLTPYRQVRADYVTFEGDLDDDEAEEFDRTFFLELLRTYLDRKGFGVDWDVVASAPGPALVNSLAMALPFEPAEKQALLEARDLADRRDALEALLAIDAAEDDDATHSVQ
ncbi:MAG: LON peptidase substrate-binding domain-containing protein [Caulobacteraceae bacterium]